MRPALSALALAYLLAPLPPVELPRRPAGIEELAFLGGTWLDDRGGGEVLEERWGAPIGNSMVGTFRWYRRDVAWLYEFELIEQTEEGLFLHLRHFGPGSRGWEDKDAPLTFRVVELEEGRAAFQKLEGQSGAGRIVFRRPDPGALEIALEDDPPGAPAKVFRFRRAAD